MSKLRFAHLADLHLGGFREKKLTRLNFITFQEAINRILNEKLDFVLFAGDIFNNAMPPIELVEFVVVELNRLKKKNIPIYVIGGSHDYSNSGKSFISLLDKTGVICDVCKFKYVDSKSIELIYTKNEDLKLNLVGVLGKKNGLDKHIYTNISKQELDSNYFNIFMFHTTLNNFKPDSMKAVKTEVTTDYLPKGFDYYAGGHIHTPMIGIYDNSAISYPGALFPNNFRELNLETPGFNLCEYDFDTKEVKINREELNIYNKEYIKIEIDSLNPFEARDLIFERIEKIDFEDKIVLFELVGIIDGKISDVGVSKIVSKLYERGAFIVLKNTYKLTSKLEKKELDIQIDSENVEDLVINEILVDSESKIKDKEIILKLLEIDFLKLDGEKIAQYESRIIEIIENCLKK